MPLRICALLINLILSWGLTGLPVLAQGPPAWAAKPAKLITRGPDKAFTYYRSPDGTQTMRREMPIPQYRALATEPGEPLPRHPSIPNDWMWIGAIIAAQFSTPSGDLEEGDIANDGKDIWVRTPENIHTLPANQFTVSETGGKVNITPEPPDFAVANGVLTPKVPTP